MRIAFAIIIFACSVIGCCSERKKKLALDPKPLEVGELVWVKGAHGGQRMTVNKLKAKGQVECTWMNNGTKNQEIFDVNVLERTLGFLAFSDLDKPLPPIAKHPDPVE